MLTFNRENNSLMANKTLGQKLPSNRKKTALVNGINSELIKYIKKYKVINCSQKYCVLTIAISCESNSSKPENPNTNEQTTLIHTC